jgi:hypothetical protein
MKQILLGLAAAAMLANAATFKLDLTTPSVINGQELAPGEYKVSYNDQNMTVSKGKKTVTAPVHVESVDRKTRATAIDYTKDNDKMVVRQIRIGGSTTTLVLDQAHDEAAGGAR